MRTHPPSCFCPRCGLGYDESNVRMASGECKLCVWEQSFNTWEELKAAYLAGQNPQVIVRRVVDRRAPLKRGPYNLRRRPDMGEQT